MAGRLTATFVLLAIVCALAPAIADEPKPGDPVAPPETFRDDQRSHWAYRAPSRPALPEVHEAGWVRNPIDRFLLAELEEVGFQHAPEADRIALIRRVTFDLTGLPPSPAEVVAFVGDPGSDAYERLVDRLLASPRYGERWAQHWLDLAHYADSNGFEADAERPDAWRYRDWVVAALNADMPYNRFVALQIAGDEIEPGDPAALIATGFGRCGPREVISGNIDPAVVRQSELTEITGTVGSVFLGLTLACARCHDHKFDPIPTNDYYRLQSFFAAAELVDKPIATEAERAAEAEARNSVNARIAPLRVKQAELEAPYRESLRKRKEAMLTAAERAVLAIPEKDRTPLQVKMAEGALKATNVTWEEVAAAVAANPDHHAERERLKRAISDLEKTMPRPAPAAMALIDPKNVAPETRVLRRGDVKNRGPRVEPRPPGILLASGPADAFPKAIPPRDSTTGRRQALADWLTRPDNPLTARVIVNRLWQDHFGRGIVATPSDFGARGEAPSHPELLDWLATELVAQDWRLKPIHRLMVTSAAYHQSSLDKNPSQTADDPENTMLWRMNRRRLDAEGLRDAMLAVSGELNLTMGGPGVFVPIEKEVEDLIFTEAEVVDRWTETDDPREAHRRSLYLFRKRNVRYPLFDAFDAPDTQTACPRRVVSTHALQPLVLLNSEFAVARARALAHRIIREGGERLEDRTRCTYRIVLARDPRPVEIEQAEDFINTQLDLLRQREGDEMAEADAWLDFALAMLNRNEFVYVP